MKRLILKILIPLFTLSFINNLYAKLPEISENDVTEIFQNIMDGHVSHKRLTPIIAKRILINFLEELDPSKTYFVEEEIQQWTNPSPQTIENLIYGYYKSDFTEFFNIHKLMTRAIKRRDALEQELVTLLPPKEPIDREQFKEMAWAKNEEELLQRLKEIRLLQLEMAETLDNELKEKSLQLIQKKRENYEEDLTLASDMEIKRKILSLILKASASSLDTHTSYFTPGEASQFLIGVQQRLFGIGVQLRDDLNGLTVVKILDGGPAAKSKNLKENDRIIAVDGEPIVGMDITEAVEFIRGQEGTSVNLTILRESADENAKMKDERLEITMTRGEVVLNEMRYEKFIEPYGDGVIATLRLYSFYQDPNSSSANDIAKEIKELKEQYDLKGVILDLRYNSGGMLLQAVNVTGLFINKGIVVSIKDQSGSLHHLRDIDGKTIWDGPVVVLTSRLSASAAEIVAQTLQDYGRAILVGDNNTYGKGSFQTLTVNAQTGQINPKGEYKVTQGRYYTVSGKSPQLTGVKSDIVVPGSFSELDIGESFATNPLENDHIAEQFDDTLSDIPFFQRQKIAKLYLHNLQPKLNTYTQHLEKLTRNSQLRIEGNKTYQGFLNEIKKKTELDKEALEYYNLNDLQLTEASNILKDLIMLTEKRHTQEAA